MIVFQKRMGPPTWLQQNAVHEKTKSPNTQSSSQSTSAIVFSTNIKCMQRWKKITKDSVGQLCSLFLCDKRSQPRWWWYLVGRSPCGGIPGMSFREDNLTLQCSWNSQRSCQTWLGKMTSRLLFSLLPMPYGSNKMAGLTDGVKLFQNTLSSKWVWFIVFGMVVAVALSCRMYALKVY